MGIHRHTWWGLSALILALWGCGESEKLEAMQAPGAERLVPTWEEFLASARFLSDQGIYIANGDETFRSLEELRAYYDARAQTQAIGTRRNPLLLDLTSSNGPRNVWNESRKRQLTYCVSSGTPFHDGLVQGLQEATRKWELAADVDFIHLAQFDSSCTASQTGVWFRVETFEDDLPCDPADVGDWVESPADGSGGTCKPVSRFVAHAFFPNYEQNLRVIRVNEYFLSGPPELHNQAMDSLIHELGHVLGFRHEHIRINQTAAGCTEANTGAGEWEALTVYDKDSVMNYGGTCGGNRNRRDLSNLDRAGARLVYGPSQLIGLDTLLWILNGP